MELHEFQGDRSLPNVFLIKHLFLKITKSNLNYLYPANNFFLVDFMDEKKPSAHMVLKLTPQSIKWNAFDRFSAVISGCNRQYDWLDYFM